MKSVRIGSGAGYSGDRIEPAIEVAAQGNVDYLVLECLAERTVASAQLARLKDADGGYDPLLAERMRRLLPPCVERGVKIITNMGAANPLMAARRTQQIARALGHSGIRIAAVTGDDVLDRLPMRTLLEETGETLSALGDRVISANAYLGAAPISDALARGADIVITGRVADPSLFVGPLAHEFRWAHDDWQRLGCGTVLGHLLECGAQVTGGYFADPGCKDVPGLARVGFPIGEMDAQCNAVISKVAGSGGIISTATCKEQLLYEVFDPSCYLTPDVTADFSRVRVEQIGKDRVRVYGAGGRAAPDRLKVSVGYRDGFIGEGQISYAGEGALARARLACDIVRERMALVGMAPDEARFDLIGVNALHGDAARANDHAPYEVRLRVAIKTNCATTAERIGNEVETLYTNGPAGGGGASRAVQEVIAIGSTYVARRDVTPVVNMLEA